VSDSESRLEAARTEFKFDPAANSAAPMLSD